MNVHPADDKQTVKCCASSRALGSARRHFWLCQRPQVARKLRNKLRRVPGGTRTRDTYIRQKPRERGAPNQSLQQMVTVVTVRAKHGPRQPRPLLKLVLASKDVESFFLPCAAP